MNFRLFEREHQQETSLRLWSPPLSFYLLSFTRFIYLFFYSKRFTSLFTPVIDVTAIESGCVREMEFNWNRTLHLKLHIDCILNRKREKNANKCECTFDNECVVSRMRIEQLVSNLSAQAHYGCCHCALSFCGGAVTKIKQSTETEKLPKPR